MYTLNLEDVKSKDINLSGGKCKNTHELIQLGLNVPKAFCITTLAYQKFISFNKLASELQRLKNKYSSEKINLTEYSSTISSLFRNASIPPDIRSEISKKYSDLNLHKIAVRSSAILEDLNSASFAGQHETYLNVIGLKELETKIIDCWISLWSEKSIKYRENIHINEENDISIAIMVQEMINSEVSGIIFTKNPINQKHEFLINSSYGLGELIASGQVTPDTYVCDYESEEVINDFIGSKENMMIYKDGVGNQIEEVPKNIREKQSLNDIQIKKITNIGKKIEQHYNSQPQDIEWTLSDGKIYVLQTRPITT
ncbi:PEP/pyruvate-binding domain-containing protein [Paraliobacillus sp. JSM ZJ581]|uniref:PEP/pyruvate-binding domain-containing protein n=1 Tax=Paraliobacillus sp. JSM ZJ581 TaxID=3342118 RepID=UPI0035A93513